MQKSKKKNEFNEFLFEYQYEKNISKKFTSANEKMKWK